MKLFSYLPLIDIFRFNDLFDSISFEERVLVYVYFTQTELCFLKSDDFQFFA